MLLPQHHTLIVESAIAPEVAAARGYCSVTNRAELRRLGFGDAQCRVPALLIPVRGVTGAIVTYQIRPDKPRIEGSKALKYETPRGTRMALDIPPGIKAKLSDPKIPLFITEGARKADAAVSKGLCCIALLGVWAWRGTNEWGGKTALPDWESIALNQRQVYIVFDSDVMLKEAVHAALVRLKAFFEQRGARVAVVYLPPGEGGAKVGLDDFFAAGHSVAELLALASEEVRRPPDAEETPTSGLYLVEGGRLCRRRQTKDATVIEPLCNFTAHVEEELVVDDGAEPTRVFLLAGRLDSGEALPSARIPASRFAGMAWVAESWGLRAVVRAGQTTRDYLREAIQVLSPSARRRHVFAHTGWRVHDGLNLFLTAGGAVGAPSIEVDLGPELAGYRLPSAAEDPREAMLASLDLLHLAPRRITIPLWAAMFRAPLAHALPVCAFRPS